MFVSRRPERTQATAGLVILAGLGTFAIRQSGQSSCLILQAEEQRCSVRLRKQVLRTPYSQRSSLAEANAPLSGAALRAGLESRRVQSDSTLRVQPFVQLAYRLQVFLCVCFTRIDVGEASSRRLFSVFIQMIEA